MAHECQMLHPGSFACVGGEGAANAVKLLLTFQDFSRLLPPHL
jgi:hypothetical protein